MVAGVAGWPAQTPGRRQRRPMCDLCEPTPSAMPVIALCLKEEGDFRLWREGGRLEAWQCVAVGEPPGMKKNMGSILGQKNVTGEKWWRGLMKVKITEGEKGRKEEGRLCYLRTNLLQIQW